MNADVGLVDRFNRTALIHSAMAVEDKPTTVTLLVERGPNLVNSCDAIGRSALHWACAHGHVDTVEVLLRWRGDTSIQDSTGKLAMDLICEKNADNRDNALQIRKLIEVRHK